jgi:type II secretory pathway pseudopilin PulG
LAARRTEGGFEVLTRQTLPGGSVGAVAPIAAGFALPAVQAARQAAGRSQSMNNLKQIGLALHIYHDAHRAFPAAFNVDGQGRPLLSWRVHILPYIDQEELYKQFRLDEPWDSPHNRQLVARMPATYRAPGSRSEPGTTVYLGISGSSGVFAPPKPNAGNETFPLGIGLAEILDGTANTIAAVEASDARAVVWTKPEDYEPDPDDPLNGLVGLRPGGFTALLCDGSVRFMNADSGREAAKKMYTKAGGEAVLQP